ncbi:MAG: hypothetical protein JSS22_15700 [Proteobacteria bacterium]|nr:hypothetical protein [Pseudomonadota bacterium]
MSEFATEILRETLPAMSDPSREMDELLGDLDLVLRCRCCEPRDRFIAIESWPAADTPGSAEMTLSESHWGSTR